LQIWSPKLQEGPVLIRSDSAVACAMAKQLKSPTKPLNYLATELALLLERAKIPRLLHNTCQGN
jgi:hypothetical protein